VRFGSVCSGIEAASVAFEPLGWKAAWFSEIEPFPSAVLAIHYPTVPNLGDMTKIAERIAAGEVEAPDMLCGGTPCQAFSVAGLRQSLSDERGNLSLVFCELADAIDHTRIQRGAEPCVVFWENVPGVLNTKDNAFGCFLGALAGESDALVPPGGKWANAGAVLGPKRAIAWRVLDAQYFGLAQRRKRVFVVASAREGFDPAEVLFEFDGVRRDSAPSREAGEGTAGRTEVGPGIDFQNVADTQDLCGTMLGEAQRKGGQAGLGVLEPASVQTHRDARNAGGMGRLDYESETLIPQTFACGGIGAYSYSSSSSSLMASGSDLGPGCETLVTHSLRGEGFDASEDGTGRGTPLVPVAFSSKDYGNDATFGLSPTLRAMGHSGSHANGGGQMAVAVGVTVHGTDPTVQKIASYDETAQCLRARTPGNIDNSSTTVVQHSMQVRRLTPRECERLQGFPDDYTLIPWRKKPADECPDGPRYKALGNSWAVPCVRWIGRRIQAHLGGDARPVLRMHPTLVPKFHAFLRRIQQGVAA